MSEANSNTVEIAHQALVGPFVLWAVSPAGSTRRIPLPRDGRVYLGQDRSSSRAPIDDGALFVALDDRTVSSLHARLDLCEGRARIVDLRSRNGTWIGGGRVEAAEVPVGGCIVMGRTVLSLEEAAGSTAPPAVDGESEHATSGEPLPGFIGQAPAIRLLAAQVRAYSQLSAPVLVRGESGSGKEVVARALHALSPRAQAPFHAINLAALPRELAEAELFGHERGAFTGANTARAGVFETAHGGTLFLDELGELPLDLQAKLLRVLESGEVRRLGARTARRVDTRVVSATWAPLEQRIAAGAFREDLFHRIAVLMVEIPPLRERRSDLPHIARHILTQHAAELGTRDLAPAALSKLCDEAWPGNVRELRNVLYRAAAHTRGTVIALADLQRAMGTSSSRGSTRPSRNRAAAVAMVQTHGSIAAAARASGLPRETLRDWFHAAQGNTR